MKAEERAIQGMHREPHGPYAGDVQSSEMPGWLVQATDLVHARYRETLNSRAISEAVGVDPAHLAAAFRRVHGVTPRRYVQRLRVHWAAHQLTRTEEPIARIAIEAGFSDQPHLTRCFRRMTGATPAAYRRAHSALRRWPSEDC